MMTYIMFVVILTSGGVATESFQFHNQAKCSEALGNYIKRFEMKHSVVVKGYCEKKY